VACALLYFAITYVLLLSKLRGYRKQPYTFVQVGLVYNTLQVGLMAIYGCSSFHESAPQITNTTVFSGCSRHQAACHQICRESREHRLHAAHGVIMVCQSELGGQHCLKDSIVQTWYCAVAK